jgi:membrane-bound ClpP family serine protease
VHVTVSSWVLLVVLACFVPWAALCKTLRAWAYHLACQALRLYLQRRDKSTVIVYTGTIECGTASALVQRIMQVTAGRELVLVIDTFGGDTYAGVQIAHALSAHPGKVTIRVPDVCASSGTVIATAGDRIVMGPHATLSYTDVIAYADPTEVRTAMRLVADEQGKPIDSVRAHASLLRVAQAVADARIARGQHGSTARALAERLTFARVDHWTPLFPEEARAVGLTIEIDRDPVWYLLVCLSCWSR